MKLKMRFDNRAEAGRKLAERLQEYRGKDVVVLGLARGGVEVAAEVARALGSPLDVMIARKLGAPWQPELGIGAVAPGGVRVVDEYLTSRLKLTEEDIDRIAARESQELERRLELYQRGRDAVDVEGKTVILVDDGLATGVTAVAAARSLRQRHPKRLILAIPVCSWQGAKILAPEVDDIVCYITPEDLHAVGLWYEDFSQTSDEEVIALLSEQGGNESAPDIRAARGDSR